MEEFVLNDMVKKTKWENLLLIDSAATSTEELGNGIHYGTMRKLRQVGIVNASHRARQMQRADYSRYDYFIGMDQYNLRNMRRILSGDPEGKISLLLDYTDRKGQSIADPWYTGNFDDTYEDVLQGCRGFLKYLEENE